MKIPELDELFEKYKMTCPILATQLGCNALRIKHIKTGKIKNVTEHEIKSIRNILRFYKQNAKNTGIR